MDHEIVFIMRNISKTFPGVKALDNVTFEVRSGEVHALCGENGAGKSTLMKILSGLYRPDPGGAIIFRGRPVLINNARHAQDLGISIIHQELNLCRNLTVAQNIFLGRESTRAGVLDEAAQNEKARHYLDILDAKIDPREKVGNLGIAEQQMVEISKALSYESQVIIMDEPTSSLTMNESARLLETVRGLRDHGKSIIYISHRLEELFKVADRVSVLKDGCLVGTRDLQGLTHDEVVQMMVGREVAKFFRNRALPPPGQEAKVILEVKGLSSRGAFKDVGFQLRAGEVLGFSGLVGAGRTEVMEALFGLRRIDAGEVQIDGVRTVIRRPLDSIRRGVGMTSEDRKNKSLFLNFNVRENVTVSQLRELFPAPYVSSTSERGFVKRFVELLNMRPPDPEMMVANMSGGNQQKVVIAKCLATLPNILIMDEPTRGIDVGAKAEIYGIIHRLAAEGKGVIVVSSDLPEILAVSDRIIVMNKGRVYADIPACDACEENVMAHCCAP